MIQAALQRVLDGHDLGRNEARGVMGTVMSGDCTPAQIAGFVVALRAKGETAAEIAGCAEAMREHALAVRPQRDDLVDTAGTGDGRAHTSTAAEIVAAAAARESRSTEPGGSSASGSPRPRGVGFALERAQRIALSIDHPRLRLPLRPRHHGDAPAARCASSGTARLQGSARDHPAAHGRRSSASTLRTRAHIADVPPPVAGARRRARRRRGSRAVPAAPTRRGRRRPGGEYELDPLDSSSRAAIRPEPRRLADDNGRLASLAVRMEGDATDPLTPGAIARGPADASRWLALAQRGSIGAPGDRLEA